MADSFKVLKHFRGGGRTAINFSVYLDVSYIDKWCLYLQLLNCNSHLSVVLNQQIWLTHF